MNSKELAKETHNTRIASAIASAEKRGHTMRDLTDLEVAILAPGVIAICSTCSANLRFYKGEFGGEAGYTRCPIEIPQTKKAVPLESVYADTTLPEWASLINEWAQGKGWNEKLSADHFDGLIALMHSELSEALEEWRNGHGMTEIYFVKDKDGNDKPEGVPIELVDCIIRILHTMHFFDMDVAKAMRLKHTYNITRPYRHGGKRS